MPFRKRLAAALLVAASVATHAQSPISADPAADKTNPAAMESFQLPSHGALLNALVYVAAGPGPHPVVILLHGFPGNERNLDIAQSIRRAGWDVLFFDYRGSWGTPGEFSFTHSLEDTQAAVNYFHDPANAKKFRADPANIVLIGHSMGGFMAAYVGAHDPSVKAVGLISAADMGGRIPATLKPEQEPAAIKGIAAGLAAQGMAPLAGCTPESLARDILDHHAAWTIPSLAPLLATRPMLVITSDDGLAPSSDALVAGLAKAGDQEVTAVHLPTDHSYSDQRIALQQAILKGLDYLRSR